jgi:subtilisin family serine protease
MNKIALIITVVLGSVQAPSQRVIPNDPFFKYQVSFLNPGGQISIERTSIKASPITLDGAAGIDPDITRAWTISTGSRKVVVAVLDDGFFYNHEDLSGNIWTNPGESGLGASGHPKETNGIDDDGNGYVDDVMGWDFAFDDPDPDCYVFDGMRKDRIQPYWHSIAALGIIGAGGNNGIGVAEGIKEGIFKCDYFRNKGYGLFLAAEILGMTGLSISETGEPGSGARIEIRVPQGSYRFIETTN